MSQELCKRGGLLLHKFNSNEEAALSCSDTSERAANTEPLGFDPTPSERALGIQWSIKDDTFSFNISLKDQPSARRGCLSVFDRLSVRSTRTHCSIQPKWKMYPSRALSQRHRMGWPAPRRYEATVGGMDKWSSQVERGLNSEVLPPT